MHSKKLGSIGELAVALELSKKKYPVFTELGDLSKTDLVVLVEEVPIKVQVKCLSLVRGRIELTSEKSGPNYRFVYEKKHVDVFAVYVHEKDVIVYVAASKLLKTTGTKASMSIRFEVAKNNQTPTHWWEDYLSFEQALRGHTPRTLPEELVSEGEEMVQTATLPTQEEARET